MSKTSPRGNERAEARAAFLHQNGWGAASAAPLAGDASTRSYVRLKNGAERALLMDAPPGAEAAACPPSASPEERRALGYNALARLAGPNLNAFTAMSAALRRLGLSAPEVYAADPASGLALIEDLGDDLYSRAINAGADEEALYAAAIDALLRLHAAAEDALTSFETAPWRPLSYDETAYRTETELLPFWFWPLVRGEKAPDEALQSFAHAWDGPLSLLSGPSRLVLRDFHADNVLWLPDRKGYARAGLIDFQDGLVGHGAYDLASLLEDARRDVSDALAAAMLARYADAAKTEIAGFDEEEFRAAYAVLGAQRNAKILGIFARLSERDGKKRYLDFMPRVWACFCKDLEHPSLAELKRWTETHITPHVAY